MTGNAVVPFATLAQQVKQYLADLGVEVRIDFARDELCVVSITAPLDGRAMPLREGGIRLEPGAVLYI